jgi:hypothetical protein
MYATMISEYIVIKTASGSKRDHDDGSNNCVENIVWKEGSQGSPFGKLKVYVLLAWLGWF